MKELLQKAADKVLIDCLNLRRHEMTLLLCDSACCEIGNIFYDILVHRCKETVFTIIPVRKEDGDELPGPVVELLKQFDTALIITEKLIHSGSLKSTLSQCGVRTAVMSGLTSEVFARTAGADWRKLGINTRRIAAQLSAAKKVTIVSKNDLSLVIEKPEIIASVDDGRLSSPGAFGQIPAGEVTVALSECHCNGCISIEGSLSALGRLDQPLILEIQDGIVKKVHDHPHAAFLEKKLSLFKQARILTEFGIGTLDTAVISGNVVEDRKAFGAVHITLGATVSAKMNFFATVATVPSEIIIDDRVWMRSGVLV
ncbi:MAG TPA: aminopeptidase [Chitinispirillaceae bacterium]|nr:aminopeptidase [Chitinispirillaceae bacterium]